MPIQSCRQQPRAAQLAVGEDIVTVDPSGDRIELRLGPFVVSGSAGEWRAMVARELEDVESAEVLPAPTADAWLGPRRPILVGETE